MENSMTEQNVLKKLGINDFGQLKRENCMQFASILDKMEPEVAQKALEQFPEFAKTSKEILCGYREIIERGILSNDASMKAVYDAYNSIKEKDKAKVIYLSPQGKKLNQKKVESLAKEKNLILVCGHYEGIDQRVLDEIVDEEISIGDYVLTGGELPSMVLIDSISRYIEGVITNESIKEESFSNGLLEYPQYTRPEVFEGESVPEILLSGHHEKIDRWRKQKSLEITKRKRPDLLKN